VEILVAILLAAWVASVLLGYALPRFAAYFLGPLLLVAGIVMFTTLNRYFFPFQSDGSPAGMIVPGLLWIALIICGVAGLTLVGVGVSRLRAAAALDSATAGAEVEPRDGVEFRAEAEPRDG
jgi:hypothetical protein